MAFITAPFVGRDDEGDPGGRDFLVGHLKDASGADMPVRVEAVFWDSAPQEPGLELAVGWEAPAAPTYASTTTFTVSGNLTKRYAAGYPLRVVTTASAGVWLYTYVVSSSYSSPNTTVTVGHAILDSGINTGGSVDAINSSPSAVGSGYVVGDLLTVSGGTTPAKVRAIAVSAGTVTSLRLEQPGSGYTTGTGKATTGGTGTGCTVEITAITAPVQQSGEFEVEYGRYSIGGEDLLSIRMLAGADGGVVVQVSNPALSNPADAIEEIMSNTKWGLAQTIGAASFAAAVMLLTTAGLGTAVSGALGGDRQQRRAGDVLSELLQMRGMTLLYDGENARWDLYVDQVPNAATLTFGFGDGVYNNIKSVESYTRTPLDNAVQTLKLRYANSGRVKVSTDYGAVFSPTDYLYSIKSSVLAFGEERILTSPWLRKFDPAARVLAYLAKRLKYEDRRVTFTAGYEARNITLVDRNGKPTLVRVRVPSSGLDADMRVVRIERRLNDTKLTAVGYDASIYTYSDADVGFDDGAGLLTQADAADPDRRATTPGVGSNLILNSDFSVPLRSASLDDAMIPGWELSTAALVSSVSITRTGNTALACIGGGYLEITSSSGTPTLTNQGDLLDTFDFGAPAQARRIYINSIYTDNPNHLQMTFYWFGSDNTLISFVTPNLRVDPNDVNGNGWKRVYAVARAPNNPSATVRTAYVFVANRMLVAGDTYRFDAAQLEQVGRRTRRPTHWKRHTNSISLSR